MKKITITNFTDNLTDVEMLSYVKVVVNQGLLSESKNGPCYAFVTCFDDDTRVYAERTPKGMHTFIVERVPQ